MGCVCGVSGFGYEETLIRNIQDFSGYENVFDNSLLYPYSPKTPSNTLSKLSHKFPHQNSPITSLIKSFYGARPLFDGLLLHLFNQAGDDLTQEFTQWFRDYFCADMSTLDRNMAMLSTSAVIAQMLSPFLQISMCRRGECSNFLRRNYDELMGYGKGESLVGTRTDWCLRLLMIFIFVLTTFHFSHHTFLKKLKNHPEKTTSNNNNKSPLILSPK